MRVFQSVFLLGCLGLLFGPRDLLAQDSAALSLAPHRAIYTVTLASAKQGVGIHDVSGQMFFDLTDACDGWAVQQHMQLRFAFPEGDMSEVASDIVTWESKDSSKFNFNVRRVSNGKEDENFKGRATLGEQGGEAQYTVPADKPVIAISSGTLFPMAHTSLIIEKAKAGEKLFSKRVFDGSDAAGAAIVSAFIGPALETKADGDLAEGLRNNPLLIGHKAWPTRLAFYPVTEKRAESGEPDYEMDMVMQDNGIARMMTIDYGDFSVAGVLVKVEQGESFPCSGTK
ncbi:MAG: DUF1849 family protein [Alphaproteobacteria bacterium]|nr:DUF1849 family protein [Alphaproteobacteria bacterium]